MSYTLGLYEAPAATLTAHPDPPNGPAPGDRRRWLVALALIAGCLLVYGQTFHFEFLNFDDNAYVYENQWVRSGVTASGVHWAFTTLDYFYWQPVTWLSHMLDCQVFGLAPGWHHAINLLFHIANSVLLFLVLLRLTGAMWRSTVAAAIFAVHPLRLESVVWIAERKDLLSGFFFLLAIWCYLGYVARPARPRYYMVIAVFALGLMSKPSVMTLPAILLVLDWWPLGRRAFAEKLPMFGMAVVSMLVTSVGTSRLGSLNWAGALPLSHRIANTLISYVRYLELTVWPHDLAILYPFRVAVPVWQALSAGLLLAAITALALWQARRRPYLIVGWLWFTGALLPSSGLVQVGWQAMADRFTYLPHMGLLLAAVWGAAELLREHRGAATSISCAVVLLCATMAWRHLPVWHDSVSMFADTVAATGPNPKAQHYLAAALDERGRFDEAFGHHAEAVRLAESDFLFQYSYGMALERHGETAEAVRHLERSLRAFPGNPDARRHLEEDQALLRYEPKSRP